MKKELRNISISHVSASAQQRAAFHLAESDKTRLADLIKSTYSEISGLMLVSTCNRTEIYYESATVPAAEIRDFFIENMINTDRTAAQAFFHLNNRTEDSAYHLLQVANGLRSAVVGDKQILAQIKSAYLAAMQSQSQGSILERTLQAVFRSHKRISNESAFRNGSRSTSYRALKIIEEHFGKTQIRNKKLLLIGAGEIAVDILKYAYRFGFSEICISNRTAAKANDLAKKYNASSFPWHKVEENDITGFDAIITAVSHRPGLIHNLKIEKQKMVLIDLALPANINPELQENEYVKLYNLDAVTEQIDQSDAASHESLHKVNLIISEEMQQLMTWMESSEIRTFLKEYNRYTREIIAAELQVALDSAENKPWIEELATRIAHKIVKAPAVAMRSSQRGELSENNMDFLKKAFTPN